MGLARLMGPFRLLVLTMLDPKAAAAGFEPIPGSKSLAVAGTPPPLGDCRGCGFVAHAACDGQGTLKLSVGFCGCPYRAIHEDQRRATWDTVLQAWVYPPGYIPLDKQAPAAP